MGFLGGVPNELEDTKNEGNYNEFRKESYLLPLLSLYFYRRICIQYDVVSSGRCII